MNLPDWLQLMLVTYAVWDIVFRHWIPSLIKDMMLHDWLREHGGRARGSTIRSNLSSYQGGMSLDTIVTPNRGSRCDACGKPSVVTVQAGAVTMSLCRHHGFQVFSRIEDVMNDHSTPDDD